MLFEDDFDELKSAKTAEDFYAVCCGIGFQWEDDKEVCRAYRVYEDKCDAHFLWKERRAIKKAAKSCVEEY